MGVGVLAGAVYNNKIPFPARPFGCKDTRNPSTLRLPASYLSAHECVQKGKKEESMFGTQRLRRPFVIASIVAGLFSISSLWSQTATGRIVGTVSDPTGALIPGVSISVTNVDTKIAVETITNEQ